MLLGEIQDKDEDEDADFQQQNQAENSEKEEQTLTEDKSKHETWEPIPHKICPERKRKQYPLNHKRVKETKLTKSLKWIQIW